ncbi:MAG: SDR family NAD(P)-dependent oxidoreductase [Burkholderiales bacterium]|nr:SDR family NAD(P)-dependent oxidoreductase [Burkholderiales bacterium]
MWPKSLNPRIKDWQGRRVWLIGASSGIGAALARELADRGAVLAVSARRQSALQAIARHAAQSIVIPFDVTDPNAWQGAWQALSAQWEAPDLVVFCAADYQPQRAWELDANQAKRTVDTNLTSIYYGLHHILPAMLSRGSGALALVSSVAGYMGLPNATVYGPTKAALINLAELLYVDLRPRGLGVYLVNPGFVKTQLTAKNNFSMPAIQTPKQAAEAILSGLAAGRFEISFPSHFTRPLKWASLLPYRLRFAAFGQLLGPT